MEPNVLKLVPGRVKESDSRLGRQLALAGIGRRHPNSSADQDVVDVRVDPVAFLVRHEDAHRLGHGGITAALHLVGILCMIRLCAVATGIEQLE